MKPMEYLLSVREEYVDKYRLALRELRNEGILFGVEVLAQPKVVPVDQQLSQPARHDIVIRHNDQPDEILRLEKVADAAPLRGTLQIKNVPVKVYTVAWAAFSLWVRLARPVWTRLEPWKKKWLEVGPGGEPDNDGLMGVVHSISAPTSEGGGFLFELNFGSAPVDALTELIDLLVEMGANEIELGTSDGSDHRPCFQVHCDLKSPAVQL
jgi:hypothetical protein